MLQFHNSWLTPAGDGHLAAVGDLSNLKMLKLPDTELVTQSLWTRWRSLATCRT